MDATLRRLEGTVRRYAWGSRTFIPDLQRRAATDEPEAELWLGAHASAPARVAFEGGARGLDSWIREEPEALLGASALERFGPELPFLLKVLAAERPLSIQAHPDREHARAGFARENAAGIALDAARRSYRDPNHKPELVCALTRFRALNRFREPDEIAAILEALGVSGLTPLLEPLCAEPPRTGLAASVAAWLRLAPASRAQLVAQVGEAAKARASDPVFDEIARLAAFHPGDAGVLGPAFLNLIELAPGEAMYLPVGVPHAYLGGAAIELMANSDNVLRGGLTEKFVDVDELLGVIGFDAGPCEPLVPQSVDSVEARYRAPAAEFALSRLALRPGDRWQSAGERGVEILICIEGRAALRDGHGALELLRGDAAIAPAAAGRYAVEGEGMLYRAGVGAP